MSESGRTPQNVLTFDLEHWYTATLVRESVSNPTDRVEASVERVLDILDRHDVRATFFVVGEVARSHPELVARLADDGHELATHGHTHTPLFDLDSERFGSELDRSVAAIEDATGITVDGFRAPNFSLTRKTTWALDVLTDRGFAYDSSVFPMRTPMYGVWNAPTRPYRPTRASPFADSTGTDGLLEVPVAVHPRWRVPVAGGLYARLLPVRVLTWGIDALNARGQPAVLYFHPWEFNPDVRSTAPPLHARFISYYGIERTGDVLDRLLTRYRFGPMKDVVDGLG